MGPRFIDPSLGTLFENCLPNTLDTTVASFSASVGTDGEASEDAFVITGDIPAMWLRDSTRQVLPYMSFAANDTAIAALIRGVINRHTLYVGADAHANAFNKNARGHLAARGRRHVPAGVRGDERDGHGPVRV